MREQHGVFKEADIREFFDEIYSIDNGLVGIKKSPDKDSVWIYFSVFKFSSSRTDGTDAEYDCFWHGMGPSDPLRECRHSWFSNDGYVFYINMDLMKDAMNVLLNYFDMR